MGGTDFSGPPTLTSRAYTCIHASMKTTIDLPDELLHRAKITAAKRKTTIKALVVSGLEYATRNDTPNSEAERKERSARLLEALSSVSITEPIGKFNRDEIYDRQIGRSE